MTTKNLNISHYIALSRVVGGGRRLVLRLAPAGRPLPVLEVLARIQRDRADGLLLLGHVEGPAPDALIQLARQRGLSVLGQVKGQSTPVAQAMVELRPAGGATDVLGHEGAFDLRRLTGAPFGGAQTLATEDLEALRFLEALLGRRRHSPPAGTPPTAPPSASLLEVGGRRVARACLAWLLRVGGYRLRTVLRDGQRVRGRLFDAALQGDFHLRYAPATTRFWVRGSWELAILAGSPERDRKRRLQWLIQEDTEPGDWLFFLLVGRALPALSLGDLVEPVESRLAEVSPLVALFELRAGRTRLLNGLLSGPAVRMVECLQHELAASWIRQLPRLMDGPERALALSTAGATLASWLDLLETHRRLDLATAVFIALAQLPTLLPAGRVRTLFQGDRAARDLARTRVNRLYSLGDRLVELRRWLGEVRYGDDRHAEAQLALADYDTHFAPQAAALVQAHRQLEGVIG